MKRLKFPVFLLAMLFSVAACTEDEVTPDGGANSDDDIKTRLSLFERELLVGTPAAMESSEDLYAVMAVGYVNSINTFNEFDAFFYPPEGAKKTNSPIRASNARIAASYTVYEWSYQGESVAYQFSEQSGKNVFEIFIKEQGQKDYLRFYYAEEAADGKTGTFKVFDIEGEDPSVAALIWTWEILENDSFKFIFSSTEGEFRYEVISNKDKSGNIKQYYGNELGTEIFWDAAGNGNWKSYQEGEEPEEGEWTV